MRNRTALRSEPIRKCDERAFHVNTIYWRSFMVIFSWSWCMVWGKWISIEKICGIEISGEKIRNTICDWLYGIILNIHHWLTPYNEPRSILPIESLRLCGNRLKDASRDSLLTRWRAFSYIVRFALHRGISSEDLLHSFVELQIEYWLRASYRKFVIVRRLFCLLSEHVASPDVVHEPGLLRSTTLNSDTGRYRDCQNLMN